MEALEAAVETSSSGEIEIDVKNIEALDAEKFNYVAFFLLYNMLQQERKYRKWLTIILVGVLSFLAGMQAYSGSTGG